MKLFLIAIGGAVGSVIRYLIADYIHSSSNNQHFPYGILVVNVLGCLLIGFLNVVCENKFQIDETYRSLIFIGLLGGFTTFSTFGLDTYRLINTGMYFYGIMNIVLSIILGIGAVWFGHWLGKLI